MSKFTLGLVLFFLVNNAKGQTSPGSFNQSLADSLGADKYGMKMYVLVILKPGINKNVGKGEADSLFRGHLNNISYLAKIGKLILAGPLQKNKNNYEGIFILNTDQVFDARKLLETDPAVAAKLLDVELFNWYGSAALPLYLKYHDGIKKMNF